MPHDEPLTIVIARVGPSRSLDACITGFSRELDGRGIVLVMDSVRDGRICESPGVHVVERPAGSLAPELWRDGLLRASTPLIAFSTAQMQPREGWRTAMLDALRRTDSAGVGGPISPGASLSNLDRALYLLRYANYLPPVLDSNSFDPPGDNAIYRLDRLARLDDAWRDGFWEVDVHRQLRKRGQTLASAPDAVVDFLGGGTFAPSLSHRLMHARHYGAGRTSGRSIASRMMRSASAPMVPPLLLSRIMGNLRRRGEPIAPWLPAMPYLAVLLAAWSAGEATGALFGPPARSMRAA